jgi:hypothetical protein
MTTEDPRLHAADAWHRQHAWLERQIDALTMQSRYAIEQERRLRDEVARQWEATEHQRHADDELIRGRRGRRAA